MEITFDWLNQDNNKDQFVCKAAYDRFNWMHGYWGLFGSGKVPEYVPIYATMPTLINGGATISGKKVVKGFIYMHGNMTAFASEESLNGLYNEWYGHYITDDDIETGNKKDAGTDNFRMFTTKEEAKQALNEFVDKTKKCVLEAQINLETDNIETLSNNLEAAKNRLAKLQESLNKLEQ